MNGHKIAICVAVPALALLAAGGASLAQAPRQPQALPKVVKADLPGRVIFEHQCASCHGAGPGDDGAAMLPGTTNLARRYQGDLPAALELRDDLDGDALRLFVRNGIGAMPSFRKSELSDAEIDEIAAYLQATATLSQGG